MSTTYLSSVALDRITAAQATFARHTVSRHNGRCVECLAMGPCETSQQALRTLAAYGWLPRRRPGATRPELVDHDEPDRTSTGPSVIQPRRPDRTAMGPGLVQPRRPEPGRHAARAD